jgi:hypothetical protein
MLKSTSPNQDIMTSHSANIGRLGKPPCPGSVLWTPTQQPINIICMTDLDCNSENRYGVIMEWNWSNHQVQNRT